MSEHLFRRELFIPQDRASVFPFFANARNLERITPPWVQFEVLTPGEITMRPGALIDYKIRLRGLPMRWRTRITEWNPPYSFADEQLKGPYKQWIHRHIFTEVDGGTLMTDEVRYRLPFGPLGDLVAKLVVENDVRRIFDFRNATIPELILKK